MAYMTSMMLGTGLIGQRGLDEAWHASERHAKKAHDVGRHGQLHGQLSSAQLSSAQHHHHSKVLPFRGLGLACPGDLLQAYSTLHR